MKKTLFLLGSITIVACLFGAEGHFRAYNHDKIKKQTLEDTTPHVGFAYFSGNTAGNA